MINLNMKMPKNCNECPFHGLFYCNLYKSIKGELLDISYELQEEIRSRKCLLIDEKTGHWIKSRTKEGLYVLRCSECGFINEWGIDENNGKSTYYRCPNCGLRVESEE